MSSHPIGGNLLWNHNGRLTVGVITLSKALCGPHLSDILQDSRERLDEDFIQCHFFQNTYNKHPIAYPRRRLWGNFISFSSVFVVLYSLMLNWVCYVHHVQQQKYVSWINNLCVEYKSCWKNILNIEKLCIVELLWYQDDIMHPEIISI